MPKFDSVDKLKAVSKLAQAPGGNAFLDTVTKVSKEINNTVALLRETGLLPPPTPDPPPIPSGKNRDIVSQPLPPAPPPPPNPLDMVKTALDVAIQSGVGDKPIKELLETIGPLTLKQLRGFLK